MTNVCVFLARLLTHKQYFRDCHLELDIGERKKQKNDHFGGSHEGEYITEEQENSTEEFSYDPENSTLSIIEATACDNAS